MLSSEARVDEHFAALADSGTWGRLYEGPETAANTSFRARLTRTLELLPPEAVGVLDIGCGPAPLAPALLGRGAAYVGLDLVSGMLREARVRHPRARLARGDERLPFQDTAFDAVVALGFVEYLSDVKLALTEMRRVVRPGGTVVVSVPKSIHIDIVMWTLTAPIRQVAARRWGRRSDRVHRRRFSRRELDRLAREVGLRPAGGLEYHFTPLPYPLTVLLPGLALRTGRWLENWSGRRMMGFFAHGYLGRYQRD
jgi:SAM-dependent methyltransferase